MSNNDLPCTRCKGQHHPADECCPIDYKRLYEEEMAQIMQGVTP